MKPLVSVVTAVWNGERYLRDCIESVLAQTYDHWEYVILNNCSTDRTLEIAQEYAARDPRIRIHSNERFVRVTENRNTAYRLISRDSKYCKPVDSDDMIFPECLERMVGLAERHPRVAIVGAYGVYSQADMGVYCRGVPYDGSDTVLPGRALARSYLVGQGPAVIGAPTFVMFRADIVRSRPAFMNESNIHADSESCLECLEDYDFGFVHQVLTFTRVRTESLTTISQNLNTHLPYRLYALRQYGPKYLTDLELEEQLRVCLREYYRYLGWQATKRRGRDFWRFHRDKLKALGLPLRVSRVAAATLGYGLDLLLNPKRTVEKALQRL